MCAGVWVCLCVGGGLLVELLSRLVMESVGPDRQQGVRAVPCSGATLFNPRCSTLARPTNPLICSPLASPRSLLHAPYPARRGATFEALSAPRASPPNDVSQQIVWHPCAGERTHTHAPAHMTWCRGTQRRACCWTNGRLAFECRRDTHRSSRGVSGLRVVLPRQSSETAATARMVVSDLSHWTTSVERHRKGSGRSNERQS